MGEPHRRDLESTLLKIAKALAEEPHDSIPQESTTAPAKEPKVPLGYKELIAAWVTAYRLLKGVKPFIGPRQGKAAKDLLKAVGLEDALTCVTNAFRDEWFKSTGCDLWMIFSQVNKYRVASNAVGASNYLYGGDGRSY